MILCWHRIFFNRIKDRFAIAVIDRKISESVFNARLIRWDYLIYVIISGAVFNQVNGHIGCRSPVFPYLFELDISLALFVANCQNYSAGNRPGIIFDSITVRNGFYNAVGVFLSAFVINRHVIIHFLPVVFFAKRLSGIQCSAVPQQRECH